MPTYNAPAHREYINNMIDLQQNEYEDIDEDEYVFNYNLAIFVKNLTNREKYDRLIKLLERANGPYDQKVINFLYWKLNHDDISLCEATKLLYFELKHCSRACGGVLPLILKMCVDFYGWIWGNVFWLVDGLRQ
jgi:hypothetical protein